MLRILPPPEEVVELIRDDRPDFTQAAFRIDQATRVCEQRITRSMLRRDFIAPLLHRCIGSDWMIKGLPDARYEPGASEAQIGVFTIEHKTTGEKRRIVARERDAGPEFPTAHHSLLLETSEEGGKISPQYDEPAGRDDYYVPRFYTSYLVQSMMKVANLKVTTPIIAAGFLQYEKNRKTRYEWIELHEQGYTSFKEWIETSEQTEIKSTTGITLLDALILSLTLLQFYFYTRLGVVHEDYHRGNITIQVQQDPSTTWEPYLIRSPDTERIKRYAGVFPGLRVSVKVIDWENAQHWKKRDASKHLPLIYDRYDYQNRPDETGYKSFEQSVTFYYAEMVSEIGSYDDTPVASTILKLYEKQLRDMEFYKKNIYDFMKWYASSLGLYRALDL